MNFVCPMSDANYTVVASPNSFGTAQSLQTLNKTASGFQLGSNPGMGHSFAWVAVHN